VVESWRIELQTFALRMSLFGGFLTFSKLFDMCLTLMHTKAPPCTGTNTGTRNRLIHFEDSPTTPPPSHGRTIS
ncbi:uncharacterized protein METZ01_LOCUS425170, partial [marine metagenome]